MLNAKTTANGRLFQINGKGAWRNEYKTDCMLANGEYMVVENGQIIGKWIQGTMGHQFISCK